MTVLKAAPRESFLGKPITRFRDWLKGKTKSPADRQRTQLLLVPEGQKLEHGKTYFKLFHGRNRVDENLDDWGFTGPTFGPLDWFHITYLRTFRFGADNIESEVAIVEDMFVWEGKYYGDAEIFRYQERNTKPLTKAAYSIGVHNDDGDCYDVVIKQNDRPIATLIAREVDVHPLVRAGNCHAALSPALKAAAAAIEETTEILHYEGGEPVTFLESREIERAYGALVSVTKEIKDAIALCGDESNAASEVTGDAHV